MRVLVVEDDPGLSSVLDRALARQGWTVVLAATGQDALWQVLEKEFDKAFVDVDLLLGEIDPDQADITYEGRQKMTSLSSCFAQLCHKAQTVSQINHKLEVSNGLWRGGIQLQSSGPV